MNEQVGPPESNEYGSFYAGYVSLVPEAAIVEALEKQVRDVEELFGSVSEADAGFRYQPEKWSVRQILGHLLDGERVFAFRALAFARGDTNEFPGFDENAYVANGDYDARPLGVLLEEFRHLRRANVLALRHLPPEAWTRGGVASNNRVTVRALAYIMVGHVRHHMKVVRERYAAAVG